MTQPDQAAASVGERMDGTYPVPILAEPEGGPIPSPPDQTPTSE